MSITSLALIIIQMRQDNEQVIFNGDFERKIFAGTGFEPSTFRPTSSGPADFPSLRYSPAIFCLAQLAPTWLPLASGGPSPRTRARSTQSVHVQESGCATASLTAPRYQDHLPWLFFIHPGFEDGLLVMSCCLEKITVVKSNFIWQRCRYLYAFIVS